MMMQTEKLLTFRQASQWLEAELDVRRGPKRVWEWYYYGRSGVKLEVLSVGGRLHTSREALLRFFARVTEARGGGLPEVLPVLGPGYQEMQRRARERHGGRKAL